MQGLYVHVNGTYLLCARKMSTLEIFYRLSTGYSSEIPERVYSGTTFELLLLQNMRIQQKN